MEFTKEVLTETTGNNVPHHQSTAFDWTTDIDESIGPVPSTSDFRPTMPSQPIHACTSAMDAPSDHIPTTSEPTDCTPTAYTPTASALNETSDVATEPVLADRGPIYSVHVSPIPVDPASVLPKPGPFIDPSLNAPCFPETITTASNPSSILIMFVNTPTVHAIPAHPLHDLSGLKSGV